MEKFPESFSVLTLHVEEKDAKTLALLIAERADYYLQRFATQI